MNWLDHEYLVPVIIGNSLECAVAAKMIFKRTQKRVHVFDERIPFLQRFNCAFHKVAPWRDFLIVESLTSYAQSLEGYYFPVLIVCNDFDKALIAKNSEAIESHYLVAKFEDVLEQ
jgi:hypothetical protein